MSAKFVDFNRIRLLGQPSRVNSRRECDTSTEICGVPFSVPVIAPPMTAIYSPDLLINLNSVGSGAIQPRVDTRNFINHTYCNRMFLNSSIDTAMATAELLANSDADNMILSIEVNNGYMHKLADKIKQVKDKFPNLPIFAGAVFTPDGVEFLGKAGADVVLVGVGVSTVCLTTNVTGMGLNAASTLRICANSQYKLGLLGGIREIGDVAKALALGADIVYIGHLLKGCADVNDTSHYWGMASETEKGSDNNFIEGKTLLTETKSYKSSDVVSKIQQGLQGAMSMADSLSISEFQAKVEYCEVE